MIDVNSIQRIDENSFECNNGEYLIEEMFPIDLWDCPEAFSMAKIKGYEPMTAKELDTEKLQDERLNDRDYILEEKFDGTRALVYFLSQKDVEGNDLAYCRVFSRRISKKTGFYVENTDSLPQIRETDVPSLKDTILDGEMFIEGLPFKDVSSTLNCIWDKAIDRQIEKGFITFHAFDILFYKGIDLRKMPLERRKVYLNLAIIEANNPYIVEVKYNDCGRNIDVSPYEKLHGSIEEVYQKLEKSGYLESYPIFSKEVRQGYKSLSPRAFYEYIIATNGEGLIIKPKKGKYYHKRGWEYSKIKKFLTRELIVMGFDEPTKEYTGKDVKKWSYWERISDHKRFQGNFYGDKNYIPVTKYYFYNQVGVMKLGVLIDREDYQTLAKNKRGEIVNAMQFFEGISSHLSTNFLDWNIMCVCECSGMTDEEREYFTRNKDKIVGSVVEVKANELFKDSGKMRHPRYMRVRFDKEAERCTWSDHIGDNQFY